MSLMLVLGTPPGWTKSHKAPEVEYPSTDQSLEELLKHSAEPTEPAPLTLPTPTTGRQGDQAGQPTQQDGAIVTPSTSESSKETATETVAKPQIAVSEKPSLPEHYSVWIWQENGDCLWRIAEKIYGDRDKWRLIYLANRDVIKDPNKIYPKQKLRIPSADWQP